MTYISAEESVQGASPVRLFQFLRGSTYWRYTDIGYQITLNSQTWTPAAIQMSRLSQTGDLKKDTIAIKLPVSHTFAQPFLAYSPDQPTSVTIWRGHLGETEVQLYWKGTMVQSGVTGGIISFECEPFFGGLKRPGLRRKEQRTCPHAWGQMGGCNIVASNFATTATATATLYQGRTLVISDAATMDSLVGGTVKAADGTERTIMSHVGQNVTIMSAIDSLTAAIAAAFPTGVSVTLYPNCPRTLDACLSTFNNVRNFGGFPMIPEGNPMGGENLF